MNNRLRWEEKNGAWQKKFKFSYYSNIDTKNIAIAIAKKLNNKDIIVRQDNENADAWAKDKILFTVCKSYEFSYKNSSKKEKRIKIIVYAKDIKTKIDKNMNWIRKGIHSQISRGKSKATPESLSDLRNRIHKLASE